MVGPGLAPLLLATWTRVIINFLQSLQFLPYELDHKSLFKLLKGLKSIPPAFTVATMATVKRLINTTINSHKGTVYLKQNLTF